LTQQCESVRSIDIGDTTTCSRIDAKSAATTTAGLRRFRKNRLYCSTFLIHDHDHQQTISVVATHRGRQKAVRTDSESRGLAIKKFSSPARRSLAEALQKRIFRTNRDHRFGSVLALAMVNFRSRWTIDACSHARSRRRERCERPITGRFRCRALLSADR
jgi:hypothetical protein